MRGKSWAQRNGEAEAKLEAKVVVKEADVPLEEQMEALWDWAAQTDGSGTRCIPAAEVGSAARAAALWAWAAQTDGSGTRCIPAADIMGLMRAAGMELKALCELLEPHSQAM